MTIYGKCDNKECYTYGKAATTTYREINLCLKCAKLLSKAINIIERSGLRNA